MLTFIATVFVLGIMIFFHELGHFSIAKLVGIKVHEFSMGFGPKLVGLSKGETTYNLRVFPFGGFVRMAGEGQNEEDDDPDDERSFSKKTVGQRAAVIVAGPLMNFVVAAVLLAFVFTFQGLPVATTEVQEVISGYPAEKAGVIAGDKIIAVNGQPVEDWEMVATLIGERREERITVTVERDGAEKQFDIETIKDENGQGKIGIAPSYGYQKTGFLTSMAMGAEWTGRVTVMILEFIGKMIVGQEPVELGGPVMIVSEIGKAAQVGFLFLLQMAAFLSINLGLFNLLPIPALDGSRIMFLAWEKVWGRPVDPAKENFIHLIGFGLLILLMVAVTYNDIVRLFVLDRATGQ